MVKCSKMIPLLESGVFCLDARFSTTAVFFGTMAEDLDLGFQSVQWGSRSTSACKI